MSQSIFLVPDTCVLFGDPFVEGPTAKTILAAENETGIRLVIPEIVVDELRRHVEERLSEAVQGAEKARREYAKLSGVAPYMVDLSISVSQRKAVLERFEQRFQHLTKEGRILKHPNVTTKELVDRSIRVQAPFKVNDRGMRDTLIWLTVKDFLLKNGELGLQIVLVTNDEAFYEKKGYNKLNSSLLQEIKKTGIPLCSIIATRSLQDVIEQFISGKLAQADWVSVALEGGQIEDFTASSDVVAIKINEWMFDNPDVFDAHNAFGYVFVEFDVVEDVMFDGVKQALDLGDGHFLVESNWTCGGVIQGYHDPYYYETLEVAMEFTLSSMISTEGSRLHVEAHEVSEVDVNSPPKSRLYLEADV